MEEGFQNIDKLPLGKLLQPKQGTGLSKNRKKSLGLVKKLRDKGPSSK